MTSPTVDLIEGLAGVLNAAGIGVYIPSVAYTSGQVGIYLNDMPDTPDGAIVLTSFQPGGDDILLAMGSRSIQVRTRAGADPRDEMRLRDSIYQAFQGLRDQTFGSVHVVVMQLISVIPLGRDGNGRWEYSTNFTANVDLPVSTYRT